MYGTTLEHAQRIARTAPIGPMFLDGKNVIVTKWEVRAYSWNIANNPETYGVWPVWAYADRPDLGAQFGGPFRRITE